MLARQMPTTYFASIAVLCLLVVFVSSFGISEGRTMDSLGMDGLSSSASLVTAGKGKRAFFDSSCKGIYDRELFSQLERVCEDCYNLYRKPHVATECRRDCYNTEVFESCLKDLMMEDFISEYKEMVHMVAGKK